MKITEFLLKLYKIPIIMTAPEKFTFFYRTESPFSQFHPATFTSSPMEFGPCPDKDQDLAKITFLHCEMWMMYHKAMLFGDVTTAEEILVTAQPQKCKAFGRRVANFDESTWSGWNRAIIYAGNREKFTQNPALLQKLLNTKGTTLVEASPTDRIYGIGLSATDPRAGNRRTWRGQNLLGQVLTGLREDLDK